MPKNYLIEYELKWARTHKRPPSRGERKGDASKEEHPELNDSSQNNIDINHGNNTAVADDAAPAHATTPLSEPLSLSPEKKKVDSEELLRRLKENKVSTKYIEMKHIKAENVAQIEHMLEQFQKINSRKSGIGSSGGYIARKFQAPGPLNGHHKLMRNDSLIIPGNINSKKLPKIHLHTYRPLNHPDWDGTFATSRFINEFQQDKLNKMRPDTSPKLSRTSTFRQEILKFRMSTPESQLMSASDPNFSYNCNKHMHEMRAKTPEGSKRGVFPNNHKYPETLIELAEELWFTLLVELHNSGKDIQYSDLLEVSALREPPRAIAAVFGYICLLLGLSATWQAAKTSLLKEFRPLQNFLREIEPVTIPIRRIRKAVAHKEENLQDTSMDALMKVCKPMGKFLRWVLAFNNIGRLMISVDERKKLHTENSQFRRVIFQSTGGGADTVTSWVDDSTTAIQKQQKEEHEHFLEEHKDIIPIAESMLVFFKDLARERDILSEFSQIDVSMYEEDEDDSHLHIHGGGDDMIDADMVMKPSAMIADYERKRASMKAPSRKASSSTHSKAKELRVVADGEYEDVFEEESPTGGSAPLTAKNISHLNKSSSVKSAAVVSPPSPTANGEVHDAVNDYYHTMFDNGSDADDKSIDLNALLQMDSPAKAHPAPEIKPAESLLYSQPGSKANLDDDVPLGTQKSSSTVNTSGTTMQGITSVDDPFLLSISASQRPADASAPFTPHNHRNDLSPTQVTRKSHSSDSPQRRGSLSPTGSGNKSVKDLVNAVAEAMVGGGAPLTKSANSRGVNQSFPKVSPENNSSHVQPAPMEHGEGSFKRHKAAGKSPSHKRKSKHEFTVVEPTDEEVPNKSPASPNFLISSMMSRPRQPLITRSSMARSTRKSTTGAGPVEDSALAVVAEVVAAEVVQERDVSAMSLFEYLAYIGAEPYYPPARVEELHKAVAEEDQGATMAELELKSPVIAHIVETLTEIQHEARSPRAYQRSPRPASESAADAHHPPPHPAPLAAAVPSGSHSEDYNEEVSPYQVSPLARDGTLLLPPVKEDLDASHEGVAAAAAVAQPVSAESVEPAQVSAVSADEYEVDFEDEPSPAKVAAPVPEPTKQEEAAAPVVEEPVNEPVVAAPAAAPAVEAAEEEDPYEVDFEDDNSLAKAYDAANATAADPLPKQVQQVAAILPPEIEPVQNEGVSELMAEPEPVVAPVEVPSPSVLPAAAQQQQQEKEEEDPYDVDFEDDASLQKTTANSAEQDTAQARPDDAQLTVSDVALAENSESQPAAAAEEPSAAPVEESVVAFAVLVAEVPAGAVEQRQIIEQQQHDPYDDVENEKAPQPLQPGSVAAAAASAGDVEPEFAPATQEIPPILVPEETSAIPAEAPPSPSKVQFRETVVVIGESRGGAVGKENVRFRDSILVIGEQEAEGEIGVALEAVAEVEPQADAATTAAAPAAVREEPADPYEVDFEDAVETTTQQPSADAFAAALHADADQRDSAASEAEPPASPSKEFREAVVAEPDVNIPVAMESAIEPVEQTEQAAPAKSPSAAPTESVTAVGEANEDEFDYEVDFEPKPEEPPATGATAESAQQAAALEPEKLPILEGVSTVTPSEAPAAAAAAGKADEEGDEFDYEVGFEPKPPSEQQLEVNADTTPQPVVAEPTSPSKVQFRETAVVIGESRGGAVDKENVRFRDSILVIGEQEAECEEAAASLEPVTEEAVEQPSLLEPAAAEPQSAQPSEETLPVLTAPHVPKREADEFDYDLDFEAKPPSDAAETAQPVQQEALPPATAPTMEPPAATGDDDEFDYEVDFEPEPEEPPATDATAESAQQATAPEAEPEKSPILEGVSTVTLSEAPAAAAAGKAAEEGDEFDYEVDFEPKHAVAASDASQPEQAPSTSDATDTSPAPDILGGMVEAQEVVSQSPTEEQQPDEAKVKPSLSFDSSSAMSSPTMTPGTGKSRGAMKKHVSFACEREDTRDNDKVILFSVDSGDGSEKAYPDPTVSGMLKMDLQPIEAMEKDCPAIQEEGENSTELESCPPSDSTPADQPVPAPAPSAEVAEEKYDMDFEAPPTTTASADETPAAAAVAAAEEPRKYADAARVKVNYRNRGLWYSGTIRSCRQVEGVDCYDIAFDDGEVETKVEENRIVSEDTPAERIREPILTPKHRDIAVGDPVECNYRGRGKWYAGHVTAKHDSSGDDGQPQRYDVQYHDGEVERKIDASRIYTPKEGKTPQSAKKLPKYAVGEEVEVNFRNLGVFKPAKIVRDRQNGVYDVQYEAGTLEFRVGEALIRRTAFTFDTGVESSKYKLGDQVSVSYRGSGVWRNAAVVRVRAENVYDVEYLDNREREYRVGLSMMGPVKEDEAQATATAAAAEVPAAAKTERPQMDLLTDIADLPAVEESYAPKYAVGQRVKVNYRQRGRWYSGEVVLRQHREDGDFYNIAYDDGEIEVRVEEALILPEEEAPQPLPAGKETKRQPSMAVGTRVECNYRGKGKWYPGAIHAVHMSGDSSEEEELVDVLYDDGEMERKVRLAHILLPSPSRSSAAAKSLPKFALGDAVEVNHRSQGLWRRATIIRDREGVYDVQFEEGDIEFRVGEACMRFLNAASIAGEEEQVPSSRYQLNQAVEVNFRGSGEWRSARITKVRQGGVYDVRYLDSKAAGKEEQEYRVGEDMIRLSPAAEEN